MSPFTPVLIFIHCFIDIHLFVFFHAHSCTSSRPFFLCIHAPLLPLLCTLFHVLLYIHSCFLCFSRSFMLFSIISSVLFTPVDALLHALLDAHSEPLFTPTHALNYTNSHPFFRLCKFGICVYLYPSPRPFEHLFYAHLHPPTRPFERLIHAHLHPS